MSRLQEGRTLVPLPCEKTQQPFPYPSVADRVCWSSKHHNNQSMKVLSPPTGSQRLEVLLDTRFRPSVRDGILLMEQAGRGIRLCSTCLHRRPDGSSSFHITFLSVLLACSECILVSLFF